MTESIINESTAFREQEVILSIALDPKKISHYCISPDDFPSRVYRDIFFSINQAVMEGAADSLAVVMDKAESINPVVKASLMELVEQGIVTDPAYSIRSLRRLNETIRIAIELEQELAAYKKGDSTAISRIRDITFRSTSDDNDQYIYTMQDALKLAVEDIEDRYKQKHWLTGITTGIDILDEKICGFNKGDLVIIGARTATGKTAFMVNCLLRANVPALMISGEQPAEQIAKRAISVDGLVSSTKMRTPKLFNDGDFQKISLASGRLKTKSLYLFDKPSPTTQDVVEVARKYVKNHGVKILFVDYLGRIRGDSGKDKRLEIGGIAKSLKTLARELNIPVVCLAQLNRASENNADKQPQIVNLSESGMIETEADVIVLLHRPEMYEPHTDADKGILQMFIRKNRHGDTRKIRARWRGEYMRVDNLEGSA